MRYETRETITTLFWNLVILSFFGLTLFGALFTYRILTGHIVVKRSWLEESKKFKFKENQYRCFRYAKEVSPVSTLEIFEQQFDYLMIENRPFVCKEILPRTMDYKPTESKRI